MEAETKLVTICFESERRPRRENIYRYYTPLVEKVYGLLFQSDEKGYDGTLIERIRTDERVRQVLGETLVIESCDTGLFVTGKHEIVPLPDDPEHRPVDPVVVVSNGSVHRFPILSRLVACTEPARDILGCRECDKAGFKCLVGSDAVSSHDNVSEGKSQLLKHGKSILAGHVYVSPRTVHDSPGAVSTSNVAASAIDWSTFEENSDRLKSNAKAAAATRKFKKGNCGSCVAQKNCPIRVNSCPGRFPTEKEITDGVLAAWKDRLAKPNFPLWQLYAIARNAGEKSAKRYKRRHVMLGGVFWKDNKFQATLVAYKRYPDAVVKQIDNYKELREYFPNLPEKYDKNRWDVQPPENDTVKALWLASLVRVYTSYRKRGFHGAGSESLAVVKLAGDKSVEIQETKGTWNVYTHWESPMRDWLGFFRTFGSIPAEHIRDENRGYGYSRSCKPS